MGTLYVAPYSSAGTTENSDLPILRNALATQQVSSSGTSAQSSALPASTRYVELSSDVDCIVWLGSDPTAATATGTILWANTYKYFGIPDGVSAGSCKVAVKTI